MTVRHCRNSFFFVSFLSFPSSVFLSFPSSHAPAAGPSACAALRVGSRVGGCGFAGFAGCELRIAFKGVAFLISILTDINYYQIIIKGLMIIIIKGGWGDKYNNN